MAGHEPKANYLSGYVVHTLEAALRAVSEASSFADAVILAVNIGDDVDTVGAVTGQLAGAPHGIATIPSGWLTILDWAEKIERLGRGLPRLRV